MSMPFYVSPEQLMKDRADYARKGIARGRSVITMPYDGGIAFIAENPSNALHKVSEIYDRIAFAAVGKYNEFENLRVAGVRYADLRGYSYDRTDVTARGLANAYAQTLGTVFTTESKPLEVELVVAEVGRQPQDDQIYRLTYDGSVTDESGFVVMGGAADKVAQAIGDTFSTGLPLQHVLRLAVSALSEGNGELTADSLEVAVLERARRRRAFRRVAGTQLTGLLDGPAGGEAPAPDAADEAAPPEGPSQEQPGGGGSGTHDGTGHSGLPNDRP
ncbi:MAG: proteasome subunit alpha [Micrococcales bacterium]|nr:MAG: proteasome subunit alpha [Micrococcales bacterium]